MGTSKERKRKNRRKRIIIAYTARTIVALVLATMIFLMGCGCLYVREHFFQKETTETTEEKDKDKDKDKDGDKEISDSKDDTATDDTADKDTDKQENKSTFSYPDASGLTIVLDAGHGGNDGGTITPLDESVLEKDINLAVVKKMQSLLQACGAEVILTRESDVYVELSERSYISNQTNGDIFVSIHCNSYEDDPTIGGLEFYYYKEGTTSQEYADSFVESVAQIDGINIRDARAENYQVLRDSSIPAILIELGYLTNEEDLENLTDSDYQTLLAETLVTAIVDLFTDTTTDTTASPATDS